MSTRTRTIGRIETPRIRLARHLRAQSLEALLRAEHQLRAVVMSKERFVCDYWLTSTRSALRTEIDRRYKHPAYRSAHRARR